MSADLLTALDQLVPPPSGHGDWHDVLVRAGVERRVPAPPVARKPRRSILVALALLAVIGALVATPAFGVQRLLLDLIGRKNVSFSKAPPASNRIKKQFYDLGLGAPPRYQIQALAGQTRLAGTLSVGGKRQRLWVVPTRQGGYCYELEGFGGGCAKRPPAGPRTIAVSAGWTGRQRAGQKFEFLSGGGEVYSSRVTRLEARFEDGRVVSVPFIWVSKPIDVGFFEFAIPVGSTPRDLVAYDRAGHVLARSKPLTPHPLVTVRHGALPKPSPPRRLPPQPPVPPSAPLQQASAGGASVIAGANGSVQFQLGGLPAPVEHVLHGGGVSYGCFRLTREFGIFDTRGYGVSGAFAPSVGLRLFGVGRPLDGCEISGSGGHRWPDRLGSHAPVELPFTPAGARYFADRAAARDLALFVRTRRVQRIRKEAAASLMRDLRVYATLLEGHQIHYRLTPTGVRFWKVSSTGRRFEVVVAHKRIVRQNLSPYAFVF